jgi:hypothetical protein
MKLHRREQNRKEQNRTEQNRTEQNKPRLMSCKQIRCPSFVSTKSGSINSTPAILTVIFVFIDNSCENPSQK